VLLGSFASCCAFVTLDFPSNIGVNGVDAKICFSMANGVLAEEAAGDIEILLYVKTRSNCVCCHRDNVMVVNALLPSIEEVRR